MLAVVRTSDVALVLAVFAASAVEMVEALTIILAVGATRGWRQSLYGAVVALLALAAVVAVSGPPIVRWVPLSVLRMVIGVLLLAFGAGWLRKAILRSAGLKARHDEDAIYEATVEELRVDNAGSRRAWAINDRVGFSVAFKGVFLEGVEVVVIVLTLGSASHRIALAGIAALAALFCVVIVGLVVARQLSSVPENAMKMAVGLMLTSFGTFWLGEGAGLHWPGSDAFLPVLVAAYGLLSAAAVVFLRGRAVLSQPPGAKAQPREFDAH